MVRENVQNIRTTITMRRWTVEALGFLDAQLWLAGILPPYGSDLDERRRDQVPARDAPLEEILDAFEVEDVCRHCQWSAPRTRSHAVFFIQELRFFGGDPCELCLQWPG